MALLAAAPGKGAVCRQIRGRAAADLASALRVTTEVTADGLRLRGLKRDSTQLEDEGQSSDECETADGSVSSS